MLEVEAEMLTSSTYRQVARVRAGDVLAVRHEVTAEHSVLKIERDETERTTPS